MIFNFIRFTSSTGGTGALTASTSTGFSRIQNASTGNRSVYYTIVEYADNTKRVPIQAESGFGAWNGTTLALTRASPPDATWVASTNTYLPAFGTATQPTAISFGTTAANIDITCAPTADNNLPTIPAYSNSLGDAIGLAPLGFPTTNLNLAMVSGVVYYSPVWIAHMGPFTQASVRMTTSASGTGPTIAIRLYEVGTNGLPGKSLANFGSVTCTATSPVTLTTTALTTPAPMPPGWYYQGLLFLVGGGSGAPSLKAYTPVPGLAGVSMANNGHVVGLQLASQAAMTDPATAPTAITAPSQSMIPLVTYL